MWRLGEWRWIIHAILQARRTGQVVATDKKVTGGVNKAHSGSLRTIGWTELQVLYIHAGPDHQRIAKLDRENEVAPPPKVLPSVGKVC